MKYAYSFCRTNLIRPDGQRIPDDGIEQYDAGRPLQLCRHGYHASIDIMDALTYAKGPILRRVRCSCEIIPSTDKLVCRRRTEVWRVDLTRVLREWACWCARRAMQREHDAGREPDPRSWAAVEVAERYARGEATDDELSAATYAATSAAWSATWSATSAAESAAWSATWSATSAAESAAESAAWSATSAAESAESTRSAERDIQRAELLRRIDVERRRASDDGGKKTWNHFDACYHAGTDPDGSRGT